MPDKKTGEMWSIAAAYCGDMETEIMETEIFEIGGPGRNRTRNLAVMSGQL